MKTLILSLFLVCGLSSVAHSQIVSIFEAREFSDTATVTWDSVAIGGKNLAKHIEITNTSATIPLLVAFEDDTVAGTYFTVPVSSTRTLPYVIQRSYLRTKTASSTAVYRILTLR